MSNFKFKFFIEEAPDAKSFTFYDITGDYDTNINPGGWGVENDIEYGDVTGATLKIRKYVTKQEHVYELNTNANEWYLGIELSAPGEWGSVFDDEAYEFVITITTASDTHKSNRDFGFYALMKERVMKESLSYRPEMQRTKRDLVWEKLRLLDNLFYSTETDQIKHFQENLSQLKKLR